MIDGNLEVPLLTLLVGGVIVSSMLLKALFERATLPPLVGYLLLGFGLHLADSGSSFMSDHAHSLFEELAALGVIALLFRVGLESNVRGLVCQLPRAWIIWVGNVCVSGLIGYVTTRHVLGFELAPSLVVAAALTATSVGVSVGMWQGLGIGGSSMGQLLIDVAELDDISAVVLIAVISAVIPLLYAGSEPLGSIQLIGILGKLLLLLFGFGVGCLLFSRYGERRVTSLLQRIEKPPDPMLTVTGIGIVIAALAGLLGFSVAIGAFFAGLVFSRDPHAVKMNASFGAIHDLFVPFFFIGIGLHIDSSSLTSALPISGILVVAAIVGKVAGAGIPARALLPWRKAVLLGVSMVPRAEIAMVILQQGRRFGDWAVPQELFGAMAAVTAVTCVGTPLALQPLLKRWHQDEGGAV